MLNRVRKLVVIVAMISVAISSGIAPRLAHASIHGTPAKHAAEAHDQQVVEGDGHHADAMPCHDHVSPDTTPTGAPDHGCCVASCSAVAFIFAVVLLDVPGADDERVVTMAKSLRSVSLKGLDPPPRLA
jgi:hypothetical protein